MPKNKKAQQEESTESYYDQLIREKVEDMERRIASGILDQDQLTVSRVHTFVRASMPKVYVVDWFKRYRPNLIEQSKRTEIGWAMWALRRYPSREITGQKVLEIFKNSNPLEVTGEDIEAYLARRNQLEGDEQHG